MRAPGFDQLDTEQECLYASDPGFCSGWPVLEQACSLFPKHWVKAKKPLYSAKHSGMWDCLDFFPVFSNSLKGVNDTSIIKQKHVKHVLKASLFRTSHNCYTIGTYDINEDKYILEEGFMDDSGLRYDYGKLYASKTFYDSAKHRRILWGWVNESSSKDDDIKKGNS